MRKRTTISCTVISVCMALAVFVTTGCSKTAPMVTPVFQVGGSNANRVHEAIRTALIQRRWVILKNEPSAIEAKYTRENRYMAHIRVAHTGNTVKITLVDSHEMLYSQGSAGPEIRSWYNTWVGNLERDIQVAIGAQL